MSSYISKIYLFPLTNFPISTITNCDTASPMTMNQCALLNVTTSNTSISGAKVATIKVTKIEPMALKKTALFDKNPILKIDLSLRTLKMLMTDAHDKTMNAIETPTA